MVAEAVAAKKDKKGGRKTAAGKATLTVTKTKKNTKSRLNQPGPSRVLSASGHICSRGIDDQSPGDDPGDDEGLLCMMGASDDEDDFF